MREEEERRERGGRGEGPIHFLTSGLRVRSLASRIAAHTSHVEKRFSWNIVVEHT